MNERSFILGPGVAAMSTVPKVPNRGRGQTQYESA